MENHVQLNKDRYKMTPEQRDYLERAAKMGTFMLDQPGSIWIGAALRDELGYIKDQTIVEWSPGGHQYRLTPAGRIALENETESEKDN